jgi:predicted DNA-binding transcriptional regulator AlpA
MSNHTRPSSAPGRHRFPVEAGNTGYNPPSNPFNELPTIFQEIVQRHVNRHDRSAVDVEKAAEKAGFGVSTLWREVANKRFVPPVGLLERRKGWMVHEIDAVLEAKMLLSRSNLKVDIRIFVAALVEASANRATLTD